MLSKLDVQCLHTLPVVEIIIAGHLWLFSILYNEKYYFLGEGFFKRTIDPSGRFFIV